MKKKKTGIKGRTVKKLGQGLVFGKSARQRRAVKTGQLPSVGSSELFCPASCLGKITFEAWILGACVQFCEIPSDTFCFELCCLHS